LFDSTEVISVHVVSLCASRVGVTLSLPHMQPGFASRHQSKFTVALLLKPANLSGGCDPVIYTTKTNAVWCWPRGMRARRASVFMWANLLWCRERTSAPHCIGRHLHKCNTYHAVQLFKVEPRPRVRINLSCLLARRPRL
jgi:hypothetical protein